MCSGITGCGKSSTEAESNTTFKHLLFSVSSVTISTSVSFDGLLVTGLYTSTPVQSAPIPAPAAFGFGKSSSNSTLRCLEWLPCSSCQYKKLIKDLAVLFYTNKLSVTLDSVLHVVLNYEVSQWAWPSSVIHIRSQNENKTTSPFRLWQALDGWGAGMMWPRVQPDAISLMLERRKQKNWIWHDERKYETTYASPQRDKTKLHVTKKNIIMVIKSAGQMFSFRKSLVVCLNCTGFWFTNI